MTTDQPTTTIAQRLAALDTQIAALQRKRAQLDEAYYRLIERRAALVQQEKERERERCSRTT